MKNLRRQLQAPQYYLPRTSERSGLSHARGGWYNTCGVGQVHTYIVHSTGQVVPAPSDASSFYLSPILRSTIYAYVRGPEGFGPGADRIYLARPKDMRARGTVFYCIFKRIELHWARERGRPAKAPRHVTVESADRSQVCSLRESGSIWLRRRSLLGASRRSLGGEALAGGRSPATSRL